MKKIVGAVLFVVYSIIAIAVTVLLLSYNEYNISEIGGYTVYIANNDALEPEYEQGSILLIEDTSDRHVKVGDEIFIYKVINSQEYEVIIRTLASKTQQGSRIAYTTTTGEIYSNDYFIGKVDDVTVIQSPWGTILSILESKWGYLFCIVIVSLLLFLQEVFNLVIEIKYGSAKTNNGAKKSTGTAKKAGTTTKKAPVKTATKTATAPKKAEPAKVATNVNSDTQTGEKEEG